MTLRTNINPRKRTAHEILDQARAGVPISPVRVHWALIVLGDVE